MAKESVFEKIDKYRKVLQPVVRGRTDREIKIMLSHCKYYRRGRLKTLTKEEMLLNDFLLKKDLNPKTLYELFVFADYPENLKTLLQENKISMREAQGRCVRQRRLLDSTTAVELMEEMKTIIGGLEWPGMKGITQH